MGLNDGSRRGHAGLGPLPRSGTVGPGLFALVRVRTASSRGPPSRRGRSGLPRPAVGGDLPVLHVLAVARDQPETLGVHDARNGPTLVATHTWVRGQFEARRPPGVGTPSVRVRRFDCHRPDGTPCCEIAPLPSSIVRPSRGVRELGTRSELRRAPSLRGVGVRRRRRVATASHELGLPGGPPAAQAVAAPAPGSWRMLS